MKYYPFFFCRICRRKYPLFLIFYDFKLFKKLRLTQFVLGISTQKRNTTCFSFAEYAEESLSFFLKIRILQIKINQEK